MGVERVEIGPHTLYCGDALQTLATLPANSFDAIVTDPPAGIGFMGKEWDDFRRARNSADAERDNVFGRTSQKGPEYGRRGKRNTNGQADRDAYRAANPSRPGMRSQGGSDLPPDAREQFIAFLSAVMAECLRVAKPGAVMLCWAIPRTSHWTATAIEDAGWAIEDRIAHLFGTGFPKHRSKLKPACEDWWLCRKPGPKWLGVDACRVGCEPRRNQQKGMGQNLNQLSRPNGADAEDARGMGAYGVGAKQVNSDEYKDVAGRWPANVTLDEEAAAALDEMSGELTSGARKAADYQPLGFYGNAIADRPAGMERPMPALEASAGGASRFFYVAKADKADRGRGNNHPTVKSTALMRWLVRLACPEGGKLLDPFMGSGSTGKAAAVEGCAFVGIERQPDYFATATERIRAADQDQRDQLFPAAPELYEPPTLFAGAGETG